MNVMAVVKRITQQFMRDKRSLALLVIAPVLVITLIWLVLDGNEYEPEIAIDDVPPPLEEVLQEEFDNDTKEMSEEAAKQELQAGDIDAFLTIKENEVFILLEGSDATANSATLRTIQEAVQSMDAGSAAEPVIAYYYGSDQLNLFDQVGSVLIGFFIFFFVFIIGGISFLRERTQGTLEKLLSTPIKRWEIVFGYLIGFGIFTILQSLIIVSYSVFVLDIWMAGDFWQLLLVTFLLAITALSLATLLSAFANNEFQMMQFIPLIIIPQVFFSGIFPVESLAEWLQILSKLMPLTYGANAMQAIMLKGLDIWDVWQDVCIIIGFTTVFVILNIFALKKHRRL
ncbi:ABC-2 type transport system permease protein [Gracilibacillus orientalis]|uniref:ABC-2 type transport system permease protein n=1 Tax=Gracilibacillus orientalis TaxID=334253 RepID=A0A1I4Q2D7_9BACI|nr:ABC transporter permease [Gracilibacillus orientalis]SFM33820.1 ABC-2 type transport system permease protein [Gracilibacillus orientalis]